MLVCSLINLFLSIHEAFIGVRKQLQEIPIPYGISADINVLGQPWWMFALSECLIVLVFFSMYELDSSLKCLSDTVSVWCAGYVNRKNLKLEWTKFAMNICEVCFLRLLKLICNNYHSVILLAMFCLFVLCMCKYICYFAIVILPYCRSLASWILPLSLEITFNIFVCRQVRWQGSWVNLERLCIILSENIIVSYLCIKTINYFRNIHTLIHIKKMVTNAFWFVAGFPYIFLCLFQFII